MCHILKTNTKKKTDQLHVVLLVAPYALNTNFLQARRFNTCRCHSIKKKDKKKTSRFIHVKRYLLWSMQPYSPKLIMTININLMTIVIIKYYLTTVLYKYQLNWNHAMWQMGWGLSLYTHAYLSGPHTLSFSSYMNSLSACWLDLSHMHLYLMYYSFFFFFVL